MNQAKKTILFLCTGNSCRSQMAEAFLRHFHSIDYNSYSAGVKKSQVNAIANLVMQELGIDLSSHSSKITDELPIQKFDFVFTVCGHAHESCPVFPGAKIINVGFDDPPHLTADMTDQNEILQVYRRVRDEIQDFVKNIKVYTEKEIS